MVPSSVEAWAKGRKHGYEMAKREFDRKVSVGWTLLVLAMMALAGVTAGVLHFVIGESDRQRDAAVEELRVYKESVLAIGGKQPNSKGD